MTSADRTILRELARRVADIASLPEQEERRTVWFAQNRLKPLRPPVFCRPEGAWVELLLDETLQCEDHTARQVENLLRQRIYAFEHFADDQVCEFEYPVFHAVSISGWGVEPEYERPEEARGAYVWDPPIKEFSDLEKLQPPAFTHDPDETQRRVEFFEELFGDILPVRLYGYSGRVGGLIDEWTRLRGITQTFMDMADNPEFVHTALGFLSECRVKQLKGMEAEGLLSLNNGNDYISSGAFGYTDELPQPDFNGHVRLIDLWGFADAQTMSEVSPAMHEEFVLTHQLPVLELFGLNCYGCCEPLDRKLEMLKRLVPRLRRVSISPWADMRRSAEQLENQIIFSWKPNPATLAAVHFDENWVRSDIQKTLAIAREYNCVIEIVIKDTHTCNHEPWRFDRWTAIAMEEACRSAE